MCKINSTVSSSVCFGLVANFSYGCSLCVIILLRSKSLLQHYSGSPWKTSRSHFENSAMTWECISCQAILWRFGTDHGAIKWSWWWKSCRFQGIWFNSLSVEDGRNETEKALWEMQTRPPLIMLEDLTHYRKLRNFKGSPKSKAAEAHSSGQRYTCVLVKYWIMKNERQI